jgi:hypothetical protein
MRDGMLMETKSNNYSENLAKGLEFQDFVAVEFSKIGIPITSFSSKKYQYSKGENLQGFEIKYDMMFRKTGNFWIECKEKTRAENLNWVDSGIFRSDNTIFYVIGDYDGVYIMQKKVLKAMSVKYKLIENKSKTSIGFLLKVDDAEKYFDYKNFTNG